MIRMVPSNSAGHAKTYFSDALAKSDYYIDGQELEGSFEGKLAERLGLVGPATKQVFYDLIENRNSNTGQQLTPRTRKERTVGFDINFHCSKSVSILHMLSKDDHILKAFQQSVSETMRDIEAEVQTRVRKSGRQEDRTTGELIWANFLHQTARPVGKHLPDPHLHQHCFALNVTYDQEEKRFKAAKFDAAEMPYYQAMFHKRLSDKLIALGYQIRPTAHSFEVVGIPQQVIDLFSKRTDEIGRAAKEKGITDAKELDGLGARTRSKKQKGLSMEELKEEWLKQIRELEPASGKTEEQHRQELTRPVRFATPSAPTSIQQVRTPQQVRDAKTCIDYALEHCFERESVVMERRLLSNAYKYALGFSEISLEKISQLFKGDTRLIKVPEGKKQLCTTRQVLSEEKRMVDLAREGVGKIKPLYTEEPAIDPSLNEQQAAAVRHVLTTTNRVCIIRGAAGTGKTTLMREAVDLIQQAGKEVIIVAPTAQASRGVLKQEGFEQADTVARLLVDKDLQESLEGQVLWVDEAGLLGTKDMASLVALANEKHAQLVLGGDTRQHTSVIRGDALRILNKVGGIPHAEVNRIFRQLAPDYRTAVEDLSNGDVRQAFVKLNRMGAIRQVEPLAPNEALVRDYMAAIRQKKTALVISPTHKQGDEVTAHIRSKLREAGLIGKKEITVPKLVNRNYTTAEKSDWRNFSEGQIIQFNQNAGGIKRGSQWRVKVIDGREVQLIDGNNKTTNLPRHRSASYDVFEKKELALSKGDKVQIKRNGFDERNSRLNNGQELTVASISKEGKILLRNDRGKMTYQLDHQYGHIDHAHCITSHASQGKTVDAVFISQPAATFPATDARQFYVSVSRGRESVGIYTDDKTALLEHASEMGDRQSALELVYGQQRHEMHLELQQRAAPAQLPDVQPDRKDAVLQLTNERDYEPGL